MAQGHIRKGFFFYFGLFVLLLVAVFCICLVIMMFNPGKTVLWMQYFTGDGSEVHVVETTDEKDQPINLATLEDLEIKCSYADVIVEKNDKNERADGLYIINNAKGFAIAANNMPFSYDVHFENGNKKLIVDINESNGFLFFSKDVKVVVHASADSAWNMNNLNLKVTTGDGNVDIGGNSMNRQRVIGLRTVNITTVKGNIGFSNSFSSESVVADPADNSEDKNYSFFVKTTSGKITSSKNIEGELAGLRLNCNMTLDIEDRGNINLDVVDMPNNDLFLTCKYGSFDIRKINAKRVSVYSIEGNHSFGIVNGILSYSSSGDSILAPNIMVDKINGDFVFAATNDAGADPRIKIKEITGLVSVVAERGDLNVKKARNVNIQGNSLAVDVEFTADCNRIDIINQVGAVRLAFAGTVPNETNIQTTTGGVFVKITEGASFVATMKDNTTEGALVPNDRIAINIGDPMWGGQTKNPLNVNNGANRLNIKTNGGINFEVVANDYFTA